MAMNTALSGIEVLLRAHLHSVNREATQRYVKREVSGTFVDGIHVGTKVTLAEAKRTDEARQRRT